MALSAEQALTEIEKNRWAVSPQCGGGWVIDGESWGMDDADVIELARTRGSLIDAVEMAMKGEVLAVK